MAPEQKLVTGTASYDDLSREQRRRLAIAGTLRTLATVAILVAVDDLLPLDHTSGAGPVAKLVLGATAIILICLVADPHDPQIPTPQPARNRGTGIHGAALPTLVRSHLLPDRAGATNSVHRAAHLHRRHVLRRHRVHDGGIRRHLAEKRTRTPDGHRLDDPRPAAPGPRRQTVPAGRKLSQHAAPSAPTTERAHLEDPPAARQRRRPAGNAQTPTDSRGRDHPREPTGRTFLADRLPQARDADSSYPPTQRRTPLHRARLGAQTPFKPFC